MKFCEDFHISPLEWPEQPADIVMRWRRYRSIEAEAGTVTDGLAQIRARRGR